MHYLCLHRFSRKVNRREDVLGRLGRERRQNVPRPINRRWSSQAWLVAELAALLLLLCAGTSASPNEKSRRLVIHFGPHRTGSSYFQARLSIEGGVSKKLVHPKLCGSAASPQAWAAFAEYLCKGEGWEKKSGSSADKHCKPWLSRLHEILPGGRRRPDNLGRGSEPVRRGLLDTPQRDVPPSSRRKY